MEINDNFYTMGIESSCDETAVAIINSKGKILSNIVYSQIEEHKKFGGVVPEIAARKHVEKIDLILKEALDVANLNLSDISLIASTAGPGLIGGVMVGLMTGKTISFVKKIPFIGVNHLEGHALTIRMIKKIEFPYLLLLISGGHSQILIVKGVGNYEIIGRTLDDALGETFDKVAKMLDLGYPGGKEIEKKALEGKPGNLKLPRPMINKNNCDMSFSGIKTRVRHLIESDYFIDKNNIKNHKKLNLNNIENHVKFNTADLCYEFQTAISESLNNRVEKAMNIYMKKHNKLNFVIAGGVASNNRIRKSLKKATKKFNFTLHVAPANLCTDNGAMIAWAGLENYRIGNLSKLDMPAKPRWDLETLKVKV